MAAQDLQEAQNLRSAQRPSADKNSSVLLYSVEALPK